MAFGKETGTSFADVLGPLAAPQSTNAVPAWRLAISHPSKENIEIYVVQFVTNDRIRIILLDDGE